MATVRSLWCLFCMHVTSCGQGTSTQSAIPLLLLLLSGRHPGAAVHLLLLSGVGTRATPGADRFVLLADTGGRLTR